MAAGQRSNTGLSGALGLLRDPTMGWFFAGKLASTCGIWTQNVVAAVLMYELTASPFMVGLVSVSQFLGPLVLAIWAGSLSDRIDRRKVLIAGRTISGVAVLVLAALIALRGVDGFGGPVVLVTIVLTLGIGMAISVPAMQAMVPSLVEKDQLESAIALSSMTPSIGRTVGPALGAGLLLAGGPALGFAVAGAAHLMFTVVLLFIRPRRPQERPKKKPRLFGGISYLLEDRKAAALMLAVAVLSLGSDAALTLTPPKADALGGSSNYVGVLASAFGAGAILFLFMLGPLRRRTTLRNIGTMGYVMLGTGMIAAGLANQIILAAAAMVVAGTGFMMGNVTLNTRIQMRVPDHVRGRVMAIWVVAFSGSRPLAALINGSIAELVSLPVAFAVGGLLALAAIPLVRVSYRIKGAASVEAPGVETSS